MLLHSREGSGEHRLVDVNALVEESLDLPYHGARAEKQLTITIEQSLDPAAADVFPAGHHTRSAEPYLERLLCGDQAPCRNQWWRLRAKAPPQRNSATAWRSKSATMAPAFHPEGEDLQSISHDQACGEGTGLGLSISHDIIVKQHGGPISVDTQPGEFTEIKNHSAAGGLCSLPNLEAGVIFSFAMSANGAADSALAAADLLDCFNLGSFSLPPGGRKMFSTFLCRPPPMRRERLQGRSLSWTLCGHSNKAVAVPRTCQISY